MIQNSLKVKSFVYAITFLLLLISCGNKKDIVYFQDLDNVGSINSINTYNPIIRPDDMLTIVVSALDQEAVRPFNLTTINTSQGLTVTGTPTQQTYLVDTKGNIDFPVLGTIKLSGLNRIEATDLIKNKLVEYVKDPIVNIRIINFKVTVLGEVNRPGTYTVSSERLTILEALGLANDLTIQAERKNVLVIRETEGKKNSIRLNLTSRDIFSSPAYYLKQNDVIYVEPNNSRIKSSTLDRNTSQTLSLVSVLVTATALVVGIIQK